MKGAVLHGASDVRYEERADPKIVEPTDAILRLSATCICGSDPHEQRRPFNRADRVLAVGAEFATGRGVFTLIRARGAHQNEAEEHNLPLVRQGRA